MKLSHDNKYIYKVTIVACLTALYRHRDVNTKSVNHVEIETVYPQNADLVVIAASPYSATLFVCIIGYTHIKNL
jgi:hypothetical protein